ncbi:DUF4123 domain-containing protein [Hafnia alvei]|uniref:DUF4123 domain-containing protein n=2 Tax=Hafnia alvei TaxID=569 RepID=UPI0010333C87|nr:DUF4123 domain-containing protein [Hafnia alvei]KAA0263909.1 DUF4123 domain-containing protein [Hafnia alvei]TBL41396.1 DUF4123 domain-containing protein [Hafnia alvei]
MNTDRSSEKDVVSVSRWIKNTETSGSRLYAILASTNGGAALKAYYALDGKHTPQGLYADTPYANWYPVMPMLVELSPYSPFLTWVEEHATPAWGWLARSPLTESVIAQHLAGLTQVLMPNGQAVFFRYWDGRYFKQHLEFIGDKWHTVLPAFSDYWVDGKTFTCSIDNDADIPTSPWWHIPPELIEKMAAKNPEPQVNNLLQMLREEHPMIYARWAEPVLRQRLNLLITPERRQRADFIQRIITELEKG